MDIAKKREKEKSIVTLMIKLYCKKHDDIDELDLLRYVNDRIDKCPMMEQKTFCSKCKIHCYRQEYREKIKKVMRYSGPRIFFYHPILVIKHTLKG